MSRPIHVLVFHGLGEPLIWVPRSKLLQDGIIVEPKLSETVPQAVRRYATETWPRVSGQVRMVGEMRHGVLVSYGVSRPNEHIHGYTPVSADSLKGTQFEPLVERFLAAVNRERRGW